MKKSMFMASAITLAATLVIAGCAQPTSAPANGGNSNNGAGDSTKLTIFDDTYNADVGKDFVPFSGGTNAVTIDSSEHHSGAASIKIVVPSAGWTGGALVSGTSKDLHAYNALTLWAKADSAMSFDKFGFGNDANGDTTYAVEMKPVALTTTWTKYIIPIPDSSKLTAEKGLFHFATSNNGGKGGTVWLDDIAYETLDASSIAVKSVAIPTDSYTVEKGTTKNVVGTVTTITVGTTDMTIYDVAPYLLYSSTDPAVASVSATGVISALKAGSAEITASLRGVSAAGKLNVTVTEPVILSTAAAAPTLDPSKVTALYTSSKTYTESKVSSWKASWSGSGTVFEDYTIPGTSSVVKKYSMLTYAGIELDANAYIDATTRKYFHADVWVPTGSRFLIKVVNAAGGEVQLWSNETISVPAGFSTGKWVSWEADLSDLTHDGGNLTNGRSQIFQLVLDGQPGNVSTVYLDNIYFHD